MSGFGVHSDMLTAHAGAVERLTDRMRAAADAGQPLGLDAYGIVGQVFAVAAVGATRECSAAVGELADLSGAFGAGVLACRDGYRQADDGLAAGFAGMR